jgi:hypothetical protein
MCLQKAAFHRCRSYRHFAKLRHMEGSVEAYCLASDESDAMLVIFHLILGRSAPQNRVQQCRFSDQGDTRLATCNMTFNYQRQ